MRSKQAKSLCRFATLFLLLVAAVASCSAPLSGAMVEANSCIVSITFGDESSRLSFIRLNSSAIIEGVHHRTLYARTRGSDGHVVELIGAVCGGSINSLLRLDRHSVVQMAEQRLEPAQIRSRLDRATLTGNDERFRWRCVVRTPHSGFALQLKEAVVFSGLRSAQLEQTNDNLFVASADNCDVTSMMLTTALHTNAQRPQITQCENSSLVECGFPAGNHIAYPFDSESP